MLGIQTGVFRILDLHGTVYGRSKKGVPIVRFDGFQRGFNGLKMHILMNGTCNHRMMDMMKYTGYLYVKAPILTVCNKTEYLSPKVIDSFKLIFHCNAKPLMLGSRIGLYPQCDNFALPIPTCWYPETLADPTRPPIYPTRAGGM